MKRTVLWLMVVHAGCSKPVEEEITSAPEGSDMAPVDEVVVAPEALPEAPTPDAPAADVVEVEWELMDVATLAPMPIGPCDREVIGGYETRSARNPEAAARIQQAALGCLAEERWLDANFLAKSLLRRDAEPVDRFVAARVAAAFRAAFSEPCGGGTLSDIVHHVQAAAGPEYSARMLADPKFESAYRSYRWRLATMPGTDRTEERLSGTSWYNCGACGVYGDMYEYHLEAGGVGTYRSAELAEDGEGLVWSEQPLTWSVQGEVVTLNHANEQVTLTLEPSKGALTKESGGAYWDFPDECNA